MKKKRWLFLLIGLVVMIGIGGKMYLYTQKDKAEQQQEKNKLEAEKMSVKVLKNMFVDIKSVEIKKTGFNEMTGSYRMFVEMTNTKNELVSFTYSFWVNSNEIGSYGVENEQVQVEGKTKESIKVIYSNGEIEAIED